MTDARNATTDETIAVIDRFNAAFNAHDVDAVMALMTEDCVFENTSPAPDGTRVQGQAAVRAAWIELFDGTPSAVFEQEELFACGDRAVVRWLYRWAPAGDEPGHVRGVDVFRVVGGRVAEKRSYVKG